MDCLYIVMPAYNEEETISDVIAQWYPILSYGAPESRLVIADSGSTDRTHAIITELMKTHPQLEILSDTEKQHGPKLIALYNFAIARGADYVFQTDSDGQTAPPRIQNILGASPPVRWNFRQSHGTWGRQRPCLGGKSCVSASAPVFWC